MSTTSVMVDGKTYEAQADSLLIDLLIKEDIKVPYFCYHESLGPAGNCRMCMVEIEGQKRPQIACDTPITDGMVVYSEGNKLDIKKVRREILELELINHPIDCPVCDQAGECSLQDFYMSYGLHDSHMYGLEKVAKGKKIDFGSNVMHDQERCVLCERCARYTDKVTRTHELGIIGRGDECRISTMPGMKLDNPYAMNVIDLCPVGAMTSKDFRFTQRSWFLTNSDNICMGCATNCNIYVDHNKPKYKDDTIYRFRPRRNRDVNGFFMCDEGRLGYKKLQYNRQLGSSTDNEEEMFQALLSNIDVNTDDNIAVLIDASLFTEEIEAIVAFAESLGADVYCPQDCYIDEDFADDMLRSKYRAGNIKTIQNLGISAETPDNVTLLISFNHPDAKMVNAKQKVLLQTHMGMTGDLVLPIASYVENSGSVTNIEGITQHVEQAIFPNEPVPTIADWITRLSS